MVEERARRKESLVELELTLSSAPSVRPTTFMRVADLSSFLRSHSLSHLPASYTLQGAMVFLIWLVGVLYPPDIGRLISPRIAPPAPTADSKAGKEMTKKVETELQELAVVKEYRRLPGWYECRELPQRVFLSIRSFADPA